MDDSYYAVKYDAELEFPLAVSLCYYSVFIITGRILRYTAKCYLPALYQTYAADLIASFQVL